MVVHVGGPNRQNLYALYNRNGEKAHYWVKRFSWHQTIGLVLSIGGVDNGSLEQFGDPPYYRNPEVLIAFFNTETPHLMGISIQTAAGAYSWAPIEQPSWWDEKFEEELKEKLQERENELLKEEEREKYFCPMGCKYYHGKGKTATRFKVKRTWDDERDCVVLKCGKCGWISEED